MDMNIKDQSAARFAEMYEYCLQSGSPFYITLYNNLFCDTCSGSIPPCPIGQEKVRFNLINVFDEITINGDFQGERFAVLLSSSVRSDFGHKIGVVFGETSASQIATGIRIVEIGVSPESDFMIFDHFLTDAEFTDSFCKLYNFNYGNDVYQKKLSPLECGKSKEFFFIKKNGVFDIGHFPVSFLSEGSSHLYKAVAVPGGNFNNIINMVMSGNTKTCFSCKNYLYAAHKTQVTNYCYERGCMMNNAKRDVCTYFEGRV